MDWEPLAWRTMDTRWARKTLPGFALTFILLTLAWQPLIEWRVNFVQSRALQIMQPALDRLAKPSP